LTVYTREAMPKDWAQTMIDKAIAFQALKRYEDALSCVEIAIKTLRTANDAALLKWAKDSRRFIKTAMRAHWQRHQNEPLL